MRVAVVGGGMTGLAAAWRLVRAARAQGLPVELHVLEADVRWGGKVRTLRLDGGVDPSLAGALVEAGPDAIYTPKPWAVELARELGLGDRIVPARAGLRTSVLRGGRLVTLPDGLFSLMPSRLGPFVRSPLISWPGKARMGLELLVPGRRDQADESLGAFVRRRLGAEAVTYLAEPLLAGIHAADPWRLSLAATYPSFREDERRYGSLVRAMLARRRARGGRRGTHGSPFVSLAGGLEELVETLVARLQEQAVLRLRTPVTRLWPGERGWRMEAAAAGGASGSPDGGRWDAVILAVPSHRMAALAEPWDGELAGLLRRIPFASTAVVTLAYRPQDVPETSPVRRGSGVLVPSVEGRREGLVVTACTWFSSKWPHASPRGAMLVRCFVGRFGDESALDMGDEALARAAALAVERLGGLAGRPCHVAVHRWPASMPQYQVGHLETVAAIERRLGRWPGLFVAGASFRGMSLSDCVRQGDQAAQACVAYLAARASGAPRPIEERVG
ncbi:protoporphyrinogen oxidase [Geochorda subterranea]|uniref:Coproporphyrinogen III oxidase n=1 Tax=Geochorda subterranea TaxID=3109564 RepID=A0ABZ1BQF1_9FIRM|nr:protoporphyrinogen oxidase [Limnochorda sp. LNt]WRP14944.1 protoporphyrinogen oxidase [Limnochorda sp. LNt]